MDTMNEPPSAPSPRFFSPPNAGYVSLLPACALLGLVGGWLAADALHLGDEQAIRWLLVVITPLVSAGLGHFLSSRIRKGQLTTLLTIIGAVAVAGVINGVLVGFFVAPPVGMVLGLIFGLICCVPFIPAILMVAATARRVGRARLLSIIDRADRRAVWLATWVVVALAPALPVPGVTSYSGGSAVLPFASAAGILILLARDITALLRTGGLRSRLAQARPLSPEADARDKALPTVDFGLGDDELVEIAPPGAVYRDRERALMIFRGSAERARAALGWAIFADVAGLLVAVGCSLSRAHDLLMLPGGFMPSNNDLWM